MGCLNDKYNYHSKKNFIFILYQRITQKEYPYLKFMISVIMKI
jgi:hypothetical protein